MTVSNDDATQRHKAKMAKRKEVQDREVASKTIEKGLLIVHTGPGKGKSTAGFGLLLRALGHGWKVGVVQFIKGAWNTGGKNRPRAFRRSRRVAHHGRRLHVGNAGPGARYRGGEAGHGRRPRS